MPQEIYETLCRQLVQENSPPCYYKIIMSLEQILQGAFFNEYIKRGLYHSYTLFEVSLTVDKTVREHSNAVRGHAHDRQYFHAERRYDSKSWRSKFYPHLTFIDRGSDYVPGQGNI